MSEIRMKCGCSIPCNVEPTREGQKRLVPLMKPADLQTLRVSDPTVVMPEILIEVIGGSWREVRAKNVDRDRLSMVHDFVRDPRAPLALRQRAALQFGVSGGKVPRCWLTD